MVWGEAAAPPPVQTWLILVQRGWGCGWMSLGRDLGLSLITHKNATLAESRPVSLAGSTTKKMLFPSPVIWSHYTSRPWELELLTKSKLYWKLGLSTYFSWKCIFSAQRSMLGKSLGFENNKLTHGSKCLQTIFAFYLETFPESDYGEMPFWLLCTACVCPVF